MRGRNPLLTERLVVAILPPVRSSTPASRAKREKKPGELDLSNDLWTRMGGCATCMKEAN